MDKNQELINRRQFFQKAIEKTLPIIGFVALGNLLQACGDNLQLSNSLSNSSGSGNTGVSGNTGSKLIPSDASGSIGGVEYVDLGLSVLWARCNIGAKKPQGLSKTYSPFVFEDGLNFDNYLRQIFLTFGSSLESHQTINISGTRFDRATHELGSQWCSPTNEHVKELFENCEIKHYDLNNGLSDEYNQSEWGAYGVMLISKINGNSIFFCSEGTNYNNIHSVWCTGSFYLDSMGSSYYMFDPDADYKKSNLCEGPSLMYDSYDSDYLFRPIVNPNSGAGNNNQGGGGSSGCGGNCSNNCSDDCYNGCTGYCEAGCSGLCDDTCYGMCEGRCTGMCDAQCRDNCDVKCDTSCSGWCKHVSI